MKVVSVTIPLIVTISLVQSCVLNEMVIKDCSMSSIFDADSTCTEEKLGELLGVEYHETIEGACNKALSDVDKGMLPWGDVTKRGYQFDKEFFNGGTIFNTESNNNDFSKDTYRLSLIRDELLGKHGIGWPSNIDNFNNTSSCDLKAAMCCWVGSRDTTGEPIDNTEVCHHNMADSPRSAHVEGGESVFSGDSGPVNCHGFYWDDDERYKGNLLFHVAMAEGLLKNQYVRNIPGAPMCGCIEQMPVVTHTDCTAIEVSEDFKITLNEENLKIEALGDPQIDFTACGGDSFVQAYELSQVPGSSGDITSHVTEKENCDEEEAEALDSLAYRKRGDDEQWIPVAGKGYLYNPSLTKAQFNELFAKSPNQIIRRRCMECDQSHKDIYYRRYDNNGLPESLDLLHIFKNYWYDIEDNKFHTDFELYSSYDDALNNHNPWLYCNFNRDNIGFPYECGPMVKIYNQWNAFQPWHGHHHGRYHVGYYVEGEFNKEGVARAVIEE